MHAGGAKSKTNPSLLKARWNSNLTRIELAKLFGVNPDTIYNWAKRYNLNYFKHVFYEKYKEGRALKSYALCRVGLRGYEMTFPRYVVRKMGLKVGDRLRFVVKKNRCYLIKAEDEKGT